MVEKKETIDKPQPAQQTDADGAEVDPTEVSEDSKTPPAAKQTPWVALLVGTNLFLVSFAIGVNLSTASKAPGNTTHTIQIAPASLSSPEDQGSPKKKESQRIVPEGLSWKNAE